MRNKFLVSDPTSTVDGGMRLYRKERDFLIVIEHILITLYRSEGLCNYLLSKWGLKRVQSCDCGADFKIKNTYSY